MKEISLLDCTLRDGGYVNNWAFGYENIGTIISGLENANIDILELGFLRDEPVDKNRTIFSTMEQASALKGSENSKTRYSAMIEAFNPYPIEKLSNAEENVIDLVRVCIWKRCMKEHMEYCKSVVDKGYKITIQPSRVEQYNEQEFIDMLMRSNELEPYAVYVVDTWGTQSSTQICRYLELADKYLDKNVKLGYHGHNNRLQALECAQRAIEMELPRDLCIDASIMGMGRGAGNLNTELIMSFLNERFGKKYDVSGVIDLYEKCLNQFYKKTPWGYSMYYLLSAIAGCNPNFATYFSEKEYGEIKFKKFIEGLTEQEKIVFSPEFVEERIRNL